jgi:deoxyribodipyrimidine photo-lyase
MNSVVWFRLDLRLADNPALTAAVKRGSAITPVFIWSPDEESPWQPGAASRWWLHHSLHALDARLRELGSRLIIGRGPSLRTLCALASECGADSIVWNRRYEPVVIAGDKKLEESLRAQGFQVETHNAALLHEPWAIENQKGKPFQVFSAFWRNCESKPDPKEPLPSPRQLRRPRRWPKSLALDELELEPKIDWTSGLRACWIPGEARAVQRLNKFLRNAFEEYTNRRNCPGLAGTSRLSPHLHFGEISPRQIFHRIRTFAMQHDCPAATWRRSQFVVELGWREFAHHLLYHFPHTPLEPLRPEFSKFPWHNNGAGLKAWQHGKTGYPMVDAGMRELWAAGWMHNRVRMIVASFLVKDLRISWSEGAQWFWDTLVDADLANNTLGWQWTAGCGADVAPYFRVFNPVGQGEKFDPQGVYVRRWCPELAKLPDAWLHRPWEAPAAVLARAGVELGRTYPEPIVSHAVARGLALQAFAQMKQR